MAKFSKGNNSKNFFFFKFSRGNLLIILYQLTKFETHSYINFLVSLITRFSMSTFAKGNNSRENKITPYFNFTRKSTHHPLSADQMFGY